MNLLITIIVSFLIGFLLAHLFQILTVKWAMWDKKVGWQFHHSLFGLILIIISIWFPHSRAELVSAGIGIIAEHTWKCGFVFFKKW